MAKEMSIRWGSRLTSSKWDSTGHVRVGTEVVTDPAFLVTRSNQDFISWVDSSKIKRQVMKYRDEVDDFDLLQ
jgi:U3 small nucleolar ribonucleoprotein protein IMP3